MWSDKCFKMTIILLMKKSMLSMTFCLTKLETYIHSQAKRNKKIVCGLDKCSPI